MKGTFLQGKLICHTQATLGESQVCKKLIKQLNIDLSPMWPGSVMFWCCDCLLGGWLPWVWVEQPPCKSVMDCFCVLYKYLCVFVCVLDLLCSTLCRVAIWYRFGYVQELQYNNVSLLTMHIQCLSSPCFPGTNGFSFHTPVYSGNVWAILKP